MLPVTVLSGLRPRPGLGWLVPVQPLVHPATDLLVLRSIACLHRAEKLVVVAFDRHHIVIGQLAPLSLERFASHPRPPWFKLLVLVQASCASLPRRNLRTRTNTCMTRRAPGVRKRNEGSFNVMSASSDANALAQTPRT